MSFIISAGFAGIGVLFMDQPSILRETKIGQKGYVKEDVLTYLDELNSENERLKKELQEVSGQKPADPQELVKFRNQVDNLQEKLNASNNALRAAKKENEELQQQIAKLKAGGAVPGAASADDPQTKAALEAAKREIDSLRNQLKAANEKAAVPPAAPNNAQAQAAIEAAKKEIDNLRSQLKAADQKVSAAEKRAADAEKKASEAPKTAPADANAAAELAKVKQDVTKITAELNSKNEELKAKSAELQSAKKAADEMEGKIRQLTKDNEAAAKKDEEIAKLNNEIVELKANANNPAALMGSLFAEAQKTVSQLKIQAEQEAAQTTKEADEKAAAVISEANAAAEKTIKEANETAQKTITEANNQAEIAVKDANEKAGKINEMSSTVRSMLLNEIESVNIKFKDITSAINKLTDQAADRMNEAQTIIGEAKKAVEPNSENTVKLAQAPKAEFSAAKAPAASAPKAENIKTENRSVDPFASVSGGSYNSRGGSNSFSSKPHISNNNPAPEVAKPAIKKPVSNFNFDMSDLLKAAEEEAAKEEN